MDVKIFNSSSKNVWKYVFLKKNAVYEAVLYKYKNFNNRTVICCSVQSGCPVGCTFCGTGNRFIKNLKTNEIADQVKYILSNNKINTDRVKRLQIMFMSMGEPMLNWENTLGAIKKLNKSYPNAELLISTVALKSPKVLLSMIEISKVISNVGLQFSIHESNNKERNNLIPYKNKLSLQEIAEFGKIWNKETGKIPFINYCVHLKNNSKEDAKRLAKLFDPKIFNLTLSVICEKDKNKKPLSKIKINLINRFKKLVSEYGFKVRIFNPEGQDDIGGGCGQLWYVQDWLEKKRK